MSYLSLNTIAKAINILRQKVHPFLGITFLACKQARLPIGSQTNVSVDSLTREFLQTHHRLDPESSFYFQPFKSIKEWVDPKYPSAGLQAINTQTFGEVFIHERNTSDWGLASDYPYLLSARLNALGYETPCPLIALAIWVFKFRRWPTDASFDNIIEEMTSVFDLNDQDLSQLFFDDRDAFNAPLFQDRPVSGEAIARLYSAPPDSPSQVGGALRSLALEFVGPTTKLNIEFGRRLTIVTGDNGLGKSFLLEAAWWAATGNWPDQPAMPLMDEGYVPFNDVVPNISYEIEDNAGRLSKRHSNFDWKSYSWIEDTDRLTLSALAVFANANGSFVVSDPIRAKFAKPPSARLDQFSQEELWYGSSATEGLVRDWVKWERSGSAEFKRFSAILAHLSPDDLGTLRPGPIIRIPGDPREIPTIRHRYGDTPIIFASAGVQRIIGLAYLLVWAWGEHKLAAKQAGSNHFDKIIIIVDEFEAHLHPKWQRTALPAILDIDHPLEGGVAIQLIAATHSPMILASAETVFDETHDRIYHLSLVESEIDLSPMKFVKYGDASAWLTSPIFGLRYARSRDAEAAIERAKELQTSESPSPVEVAAVSDQLKQSLAPDDKFWPRWLYFAETHGVTL